MVVVLGGHAPLISASVHGELVEATTHPLASLFVIFFWVPFLGACACLCDPQNKLASCHLNDGGTF